MSGRFDAVGAKLNLANLIKWKKLLLLVQNPD